MSTPFVDIHTHCAVTPTTSGSVCLLQSYAIHPWWLDDHPEPDFIDRQLQHLETLLRDDRLAAIGETGIDHNHKDTLNLQLDSFEKHILLSEQYQKPLIIHNVGGTGELLALHKKHHPSQAWIIHGFNGTTQEAMALTKKGICLSVGESLFYPNRKITKSISSIPLDYLFLETDTSGKTIQEIYEKAAEQLNLPLGVLKQRIFANFVRLNLTTWKTGETEPGCSSATMALTNCDEATCWL